MKIFLAALPGHFYPPEKKAYRRMDSTVWSMLHSIPNMLESYFYLQKNALCVESMRHLHRKILLDSGAFTARNLGKEIEINDYIRFIQENGDIIEKDPDGNLMAIGLDVIGRDHASYANYKFMEDSGCKIMPCFHIGFGEDERYLEYYANNYDLIAIGGMVRNRQHIVKIMDRLWNKYLIDGAGNIKCRVHGLGLTQLKHIERWPWYSVDSSTWIQTALNGKIFIAEIDKQIAVSPLGQSKKKENAHIDTIAPLFRDQIDRIIIRAQFDTEKIRSGDWLYTSVFNALQFGIELPQKLKAKHHSSYQQELF